MSELDSIEKIDAARAELARHGVTLESFEVMRGRIDGLEARLAKERASHEADNKVATHWLACWREAMAEKEALRECLRELADEFDINPDGINAEMAVIKARALLGAA